MATIALEQDPLSADQLSAAPTPVVLSFSGGLVVPERASLMMGPGRESTHFPKLSPWQDRQSWEAEVRSKIDKSSGRLFFAASGFIPAAVTTVIKYGGSSAGSVEPALVELPPALGSRKG